MAVTTKKFSLSSTIIIIGLIVAFIFGGASLLAFAPWWVWAGILFFFVLIGGRRK